MKAGNALMIGRAYVRAPAWPAQPTGGGIGRGAEPPSEPMTGAELVVDGGFTAQ